MEEPVNDQVQQLLDRIERLEKREKKKDVWDIIGILSSFLIPLSIFFAGFYLTESEKKKEFANQKKEIQLAEIKSKVEQAQLVSSFLEALVDSNTYKRKLAIKSILLALPEEGEEIVMEISTNDPNEGVKEFAIKSLTDTRANLRKALIQDIFSPDKPTRLAASDRLTTRWTSDDRLVPELIKFALERFGDEAHLQSGLINTIVVLNHVDVQLLKTHEKQVALFVEKVRQLKHRPQTQTFLETLVGRLK